jgi:D-3-phosphoglycerate dehydrogenase
VNATPHVVIADSHISSWKDNFALERAIWEPMGAKVTLAECRTEDDLIAIGQDADVFGYVGLFTPFTARVLASLPRCRLVARWGIGMDSVDLEAASAHGIVVSNAAEYCVPEVAAHAAAFILMLGRRIIPLDRYVRAGNWAGRQLTGPTQRFSTLTLGIVGLGRIGRRLATYMKPLMGRIIAYDPYISQSDADPYGVQLVSLEELLATSDFVSMHTPLNPETRGMIGAEHFAQMKPAAFLINTSRGPVVREPELVAALREGRLAGAALDVFAEEPLPLDSPLRELENVVLTPHGAAFSQQSVEDLRAAVAETVAAVLRDEWPKHILNTGVVPRVTLHHRQIS